MEEIAERGESTGMKRRGGWLYNAATAVTGAWRQL